MEETESELPMQKYNFDYYALAKLKKSERQKVTALLLIIFILTCLLITFVVLFGKSSCNENLNLLKNLQAAKIAAYEKISKYGMNCYYSKDCGKNAYCTYLQGTYRCICKRGFMGDGITDCKDINFSIDFEKDTTNNIPTLKSLPLPQTDGLSVCAWFKLRESPDGWKALFQYTTTDIHEENDFMIWFHHDTITATFRHRECPTIPVEFKLRLWTHFCWTWEKIGVWKLYINGELLSHGSKFDGLFNETFPQSTGTLFLGQDSDSGIINEAIQAFPGAITQLFIYHKTLSSGDVTSMYQGNPLLNDTVVGWWQFKGKANVSSEIIEKSDPFLSA